MRAAPPVRRVLAAVTAAALLAGGLSLLGGAAAAADLKRVSESPVAGSTVAAPARISATYTQFLSPLSTIRVTNEQGPVCSGSGPVVGTPDSERRTIFCIPAPGSAASGIYTVTVNAIDTTTPLPQTLPDAYTFTVDAEASTPTGVAISPDPVTSSASAISVAATFAEAGTALYRLSSSGGESATQTVNIAGPSTSTASFTDPARFSDGTLTASVTLTDAFGNVSEPGQDTAAKDATAPQRTAYGPTGTVQSGSGATRTVASATFDENLAAGSTIVVLNQRGNELAGTQTISSTTSPPMPADTKKITFTPSVPFNEGTYTVVTTARDAVGNSEQLAFTFTVDNTAPLTVSATLQDPVNLGNVASATVSGSGSEAGLAIAVSVDDENPLTEAVEGPGTTGTDLTYSVTLNLSQLDDGPLVATVTAADAAANKSVVVKDGATKETVAPDAPSVEASPALVGNAQSRAFSVSGRVTDGSILTGSPAEVPEEGATVTVTIDDGSTATPAVIAFDVTDADGAYNIADIDVSGLQDGTLTVTAVATDSFGNASDPGTDAAVLDTTVPDAPTVSAPAYANIANAAAVPFTGSAEPGTRLVLVVEDALSATRTVTIADVPSGGAYSVSVNVSGLAEGSLAVRARATDDADNTSFAGTTSLIKDTIAPATPTVVAPAYAFSGNAAAFPVTGDTSPGATVTVTIDNQVDDVLIPAATDDDSAGSDGTYAAAVDVRALRDGNLVISAQAVDAAGNASGTGSASTTKDTKVPGAPTVSQITPDPVVSQTPVTVSGSIPEADRLEPAGSLTVHVTLADTDSGSATPATSTATIDSGSGAWSVTFTAQQVGALADGPLTARATVVDRAGNTSPAATRTAVKNATPLALQASTPATGTVVMSPEVISMTFNEPLTGRDANGNLRSSIQLRDGGNDLLNCKDRVFSDGHRTISCTPPPLTELGNPYQVTVVAYDGVGETLTSIVTFTVDTTPPPAPVVESATDPVNAQNERTVQVVVSGLSQDTATATVTITDQNARRATATVTIGTDGAGTATVDTTSLAEGLLSVTATATDGPGNESVPSDGLTLTKDTLQPSLISSSPSSGSSSSTPPSSVLLTFDEALSDSYTVRLIGPEGPISGDVSQSSDSRTVGITPDEPLAVGIYKVEADVEDVAGNAGDGASTFTVVAVEPEPTGSPTPTPTGSATSTPTATPTGSATATPTSSPTPTSTPTGSATATPTPTGSATATPTPTGSATPTPTGSATATSSPSASPTTDSGTGGGGTGGGGGGGGTGTSPTPSASTSPSPSASPSPSSSPSPSAAPRDGAGFIALTSPVRVLDSRSGIGTSRGLKRGRVVLDLSDRVPAGATAAVLNVTVTNPDATGFVVAYPDGSAKPGTSNVNVIRNQTQANEVVVGLPASRRVVLFVDSTDAHVIADLVGFFTEAERADLGRVVTQAPVRVLDSREGVGTSTGRKRGEVVLDLTGQVPAGTTAVALNVTVAGPDARGFVVAYPTGTLRPETSNVNFERGQTQANEVVVRLGTGANAGRVSLFVDSASAAVIVDLVASVVPRDGGGSQLFTALEQPQRVMDTRSGVGGTTGRRNGTVTLTLPSAAVPAGATGVVLNVTATGASRTGFVSVYPTGTANPGTSNVNFRPGVNQANEVLTAINGSRQVTLFVGGSGTPLTHVVVDVVGYLTSTG